MKSFVEQLNKAAARVAYHEDCEAEKWPLLSAETISPTIHDPQAYLYHYTSQHGGFGILQDKTLWASDPTFLNDTMEIRHGVEALARAFARLRDENPDLYSKLRRVEENLPDLGEDERELLGRLRQRAYIVSLTSLGDDLSQWRGYGGAGGVALGFALPLLARVQPRALLAPVVYASETRLAELLYQDLLFVTHKRSLAGVGSSGSSLDYSAALIARYALILPLLKDPEFASEQEWRLLVVADQVPADEVKWRSGAQFAVPYVVLSLEEQAARAGRGVKASAGTNNPVPVTLGTSCKAVLGPGAHPLAAHYFDVALKGKVTKSKVPFRSVS